MPDCRVVSFEPSPATIPFLRRTLAGSSFRDRWEVVEHAVASAPGVLDFHVASQGMGAFDSLHETGRASVKSQVAKVVVTTVDREWERLGRPLVSAMKIDVEGAELEVIRGALECISREAPFMLVEWNLPNSRAAGKRPADLLTLAEEIQYDVYCVPSMVPIKSASDLSAQMIVSETFLLHPRRLREVREG